MERKIGTRDPTPGRHRLQLSTENVVPDDNGVIAPFSPYVMFYAPFMTNADIGSEGQAGGGPAFVAALGTPNALVIVSLLSGA